MRMNMHRGLANRPRNCVTTRRSLSVFLDGEVGSGLSGLIRRHLGSCAGCAYRLEELVNVAAASHNLVGEGFRAALADAPCRFSGIVRRLSENRRTRLLRVLRSVLAFRILRSVGGKCVGLAQAGQRASLAEDRLLEQARTLARELATLDPVGEKLTLVLLERWLKGGCYDDLRKLGLLDTPPPPLRSANDPEGRARVLRWARRALREFRKTGRD